VILTERLASGARLLLEPVDRTDTLCIGYWFLHGSRDERPGEEGFSHFLEHMLFKGTRKRTALQIARDVDRVGGIINAFTEKEATCIYVILPKEHLRLAFDVLTDMTVGSLLDPEEMEKEKAVIVNEILSIDDSPEERGHEHFLRRMWGDHPLSRKITGEVAEVKRIDKDRLGSFYRERLRPSNMIVAVAGNFAPAEARELAEAIFPPGLPPAVALSRTVPSWTRDTSVVPDRFTQAQIYAGTSYSLNRDLGHYYTSLVFSTGFGESMSSRLFQKLREELALCYTVYCFRGFFSDTGMWTIYANATPGLAGKLMRELDRELGRLLAEPLSLREVADAKSHLVGSMIMAKEDMENRMKRLVRQNMMMDRVLEFDESVAVLERVSQEDVERFVRTYVRPEAFNLLAFGSKGMRGLRRFEFSFGKD
jgi:predicted Zn-dependent peptidase